MDDLASHSITTSQATIFARIGGSGPPLLLLHGFPETHLMWRHVAPLLAAKFTVVCADLRGYGQSSCPDTTRDHAPYAKRSMALDMVELMAALGFPRFSLAGHDRGGRVAYRLAMDHQNSVEKLAVLDVLPTETAWALADDRLALGFWPWSVLAQPEPLPEHILTTSAEAIVNNALDEWGSEPSMFPEAIRRAYTAALTDPTHAHAICEEYRAAADLDREHDRADLTAQHTIACPTLALWSADGPLDTWYADNSGALGLWQQWAANVSGRAIEGGHFFPEANPKETAQALSDFLAT